MSSRKYELFLFDIYIAILKIEKTLEKFNDAHSLLRDFNAWDSVIREFEIIGEGTKNLIKNGFLDENNRVVVDFRNLLIHNYFGIDPEEIWDVAKNDLPAFKQTIKSKLDIIDINLKKDLVCAYLEQNIYLEFVVEELQKLK